MSEPAPFTRGMLMGEQCEAYDHADALTRAAAYIEQLEARVARVHELLSLLDSWNVNHGPLDDPLPGNLIVSMMNTIGDPRDHGGPR